MAKKKPAIKQVSQRNELIQKLEGSEYIKNPMMYAQIVGDFKLTQYNVMLSVVKSIQKRIDEHIVEGKGIQGPIFTEQDYDKNRKVTFRFPLTDLGVDSKEYDNVWKVCEELQTLAVTHYERINKDEKRYYRNILFPEISMPTSEDKNGKERRNGYIELKMDANVAELLFNHSNQYIEHLSGIAKLCRSPRTPRLYVYLSAWKTKYTVDFSYESVKEYLGYLDYNDNHTKIIKDRCPTWAHFKRDVLEPARKELQKLAEQGKVEFYFDYEPIYNNGKTRGNPCKIMFRILSTIEMLEDMQEKEEKEAQMGLDEKWNVFLSSVVESLSEADYATWVKPMTAESFVDGVLTVSVPSKFFAEYIEEHLIDTLAVAFRKVFGDNVRLSYSVRQ